MLKRLIFGTVATATISAAAIIYTVFKNRKSESEAEEEVDEEIHFVEITDDDAEKKEEPAYSNEVKEIADVYPYLDLAFIAGLLARDDEFNEKYPEDTLTTVCHKVSFKDEAGAKEFTEIMDPAGYECVADGNAVTATRKFFTEPGAIISDVLNVANQTKALEGKYEDFTIAA